jgi:DNA invertase Pin-like site-specific DNA recombinase
MGRRRKRADVSLVVTYRRVSTEEQGESGAGLDAQESRLTAEIAVRGWTRVADFPEVASGKSAEGRERLQEALSMVRGGDAGTLMVTKLDRLCRSVLDFAMTTADAGKLGWNLVMLEPAVDLSTPHGEMMANIMASVAQWERRIIGQRTSEALRALQANGVTLGRPSGVPEHVVAFIRHGRGYGRSYRDIADALNRRGEPTGQGGVKWHPSSVRAVELSQAALSPAHDLAKYLAEGA